MTNQINDLCEMIDIESEHGLEELYQPEQKTPLITEDQHKSLDYLISGDPSQQLELLKASLQDIPEINKARVMYFKAEIASGNYEINNHIISRSLLCHVETA